MYEWIYSLVESYASVPLYQGLAAAAATFILEDPTTIISGLLVADGRMAFWTALIGVAAGIAIGDFGLYLIGACFHRRVVDWGWLQETQVRRAQRWFNRNLIAAVVLSRFVPGSRLPTYLSAGVFRASPVRFVAASVAASIVWTFVLLSATIRLGETILPMLGHLKWPVAIAAVLLFVLIQFVYRWRIRNAVPFADDADDDTLPAAVSYFEFWPPYVFYAPVALYYLWLAIRYRGMMLPMNSNPSIYSGGMIRESKDEILRLIPASQSQWVAAHVAFDRTAGQSADEALAVAREAIGKGGLAYPLVAKPDQGQRGAGVQKITCDADLRAYLDAFPADCRCVLQRLADYPNEAGILWYRLPNQERGQIFSVTLKEFPVIIGDGAHTLQQLIEHDRRAKHIKDVYLNRHRAHLDRVLAPGERFPLVFAGNHAQGTIFKNGNHIVTEALRARFDEIAASIPEFHFGRFDCRFENLDALRRGEGFCIVEINGAGAEATHIWDATTTLREAYWTLFRQFSILFQIGAANRKRGHRPIGPVQFLSDVFAYQRMAKQYPQAH